ncbi:MAG: LytTR family DNA-binding domain-containing protein, partial [Cyclobacteriaceae bacterium]
LGELELVPEVIFVTAYDQYALKAFEENALDYLQKPVKLERLHSAVEKALQHIRARKKKADEEKLGLADQVFVKDGDNCWFIELSQIRLFQIEGNYTRVFFQNEKPLIPRSLSYMEQRLSEKYFFRANRQEIVNLKWVENIEPWFSGTIKAYLKGGDEVEVSRRQSIKFKELMSF